MSDEPEAMREIHAIREALYEKTKEMSSSERVQHMRRELAELEKRHGRSFKRAEPRSRETVSR